MKKKLLILFLFTFTISFSQTWVSQGTGFTSESRGLLDIQVLNATTVWALAFDGAPPVPPATETENIQEFTRTIDGGEEWTPGIINVGNPLYTINNISAVNATTAWVSAIDPSVDGETDPNDGTGVVYKTSDGGATWEQQIPEGFQIPGSSFLNGVHFFDENVGIAYGDPVGSDFEIYRTTDGGENWTPVAPANIPAPATDEYGYNGGPISAGNSFWFTTNKGKLYRTTNFGVNWTKLNSPLTDFGSAAINGRVFFSDNNIGLILGTTNGSATNPTYRIWRTTDGGSTWSTPTTYTGYRLLTYIPGTSILVATGLGTGTGGTGSAYSINNGVTWTTIDTGAQRGTPGFINPSTGWCGGYTSDDPLAEEGVFKLDGSLSNQKFESINFTVYPNPSHSTISIKTTLDQDYKVKVIDMTGKIMLQKNLSGLENNLDISGFSTGVYFFTFISGDTAETLKIMKN